MKKFRKNNIVSSTVTIEVKFTVKNIFFLLGKRGIDHYSSCGNGSEET